MKLERILYIASNCFQWDWWPAGLKAGFTAHDIEFIPVNLVYRDISPLIQEYKPDLILSLGYHRDSLEGTQNIPMVTWYICAPVLFDASCILKEFPVPSENDCLAFCYYSWW